MIGRIGPVLEVARRSGAVAPERALQRALGGGWEQTARGGVYAVRSTYPLDHAHGSYRLREFLDVSTRALAALCRQPEIETQAAASAVFVDTETTGLDPLSGAYAFLVGLGYFEADRFSVVQYFMPDPGGERALARAVAQALSAFGLLVTFNGRNFDAPMLATRFAVHGQPHGLGDMPHADLLHPARRLWKERLQSCRLSSLEERILGVSRTDDVPSSAVPGMYDAFLADGDARRLAPVFYHNAQDLLTLPALATHAVGVYSEPFDGRVRHALDFLSLGKLYEATGDAGRAIQAYDRALGMPLHASARGDVCRRLVPLYRQAARFDHAVALWERMVAAPDAHGIYPFEELAKHYEHTARRYDRAEELVLEALRLLPTDPCTRTTQRDLLKRLDRIRSKRVPPEGP